MSDTVAMSLETAAALTGALDQVITNMVAIINATDDPTVIEMAEHTAEMCHRVLYGEAGESEDAGRAAIGGTPT